MSTSLQFINVLEAGIIDKSYLLSKYEDDVITYHWLQKNIILDILIKENICAINNNNDVSWYSLETENVALRILRMINTLNRSKFL